MTQLLETFKLARLPAEAEALRGEIRAFLEQELAGVPVDVRSRSWLAFDAAFSRKLAARGWVGMTLPREYGGGGRDAYSRFALVEELLLAGAPVAAHWIAERQSGPLILRYGSEAQKRMFLPKICAAQAFFCIGMSEPNAGSDLASVRSRVVKDARGWVFNGRKIWTTNAHYCHYMIALARTSGEPESRQAGLSQFIIDLSAPGVTVRPIVDLTGGAHFSEVFIDDVVLADDALVGFEGAGWEQVNSELAFERSEPERIYSSIVLLERWLELLRKSPDSDAHAATIGRFAVHLTTLRNMSIAVTAKLARGESPVVEAALVKDLGTEFEQSIPAVIEGLTGGLECDALDPAFYRALAYVSAMAPSFSLRGGTREILRGMIARGLGLR